MVIRDLNSIKFPFLKQLSNYQNSIILVDLPEQGLTDIDVIQKNKQDQYIHKDFRVREVALMKGYSGTYEEQEVKLNSHRKPDYEFWMYASETIRHRKDQIIKIVNAIIF